MKQIGDLRVKLFADGAEKADMLEMNQKSHIQGLTTNPTLMKKAGIQDYKAFAQDILSEIKYKPISFEVFTDDFIEMERQAFEIASWAENVYVKIPVTNTQQQTCYELVKKLTGQKVKVNITAVMTLNQVDNILPNLSSTVPSYVSIFAGRIADTGRDPIPLMREAVKHLEAVPAAELIWASPRELLNILQAQEVGCHIITATKDILKKLAYLGYDLDQYSLDTVRMFYDDAVSAGYRF